MTKLLLCGASESCAGGGGPPARLTAGKTTTTIFSTLGVKEVAKINSLVISSVVGNLFSAKRRVWDPAGKIKISP